MYRFSFLHTAKWVANYTATHLNTHAYGLPPGLSAVWMTVVTAPVRELAGSILTREGTPLTTKPPSDVQRSGP